jgi:acetate---CoA ligase (ADP-forming)
VSVPTADHQGDDYHGTDRYARSLERLVAPENVVVVGASPKGVGRTSVENLRRLEFDGPVVCVNPKYEDVLGYPCVPTIAEVPFQPDAVLLAVSADHVPTLMEEAAEKGAAGAVVFAFGFADHGEPGRQLQGRVTEIAAGAGMALVGPNCHGLINFTKSLALYMEGVQPYRPGRVALVAESGSVFTSLVNNRRGVRWSHAVSSGNEAVTDAADFVTLFARSPEVDIVCAFLETVRRPRAFLAACEKAYETGTRIVVCLVGRTQEARTVALTHSGALALPHELMTSALADRGTLVVTSLEQMLATTVALQSARKPSGNRIAVLTASGGQIELVLDNVQECELEIASLSPETLTTLDQLLPAFLPTRNPLDWWGLPDYQSAVPAITSAMAADPRVDIVVHVGDFAVGPTGDGSRASEKMQYLEGARTTSKKVFAILDSVAGAPSPQDVEQALETGIVVVAGFTEGLRALGHLARASRPLPARRPVGGGPGVGEVADTWRRSPVDVLSGGGALELIRAAGFDVARDVVVSTPEEALEAASTLGYPVVLKIADDDVAHRTELGGVAVGLISESMVRSAAVDLLQRSKTVMVQEQICGGRELIVGVKSVASLGAFLLVGLGGVWAELVNDVQTRPVGLRKGAAREMVQALRAYPALTGARGAEPIDVDLVVKAIETLDELALACGTDVDAIDINPLIVSSERAVVVDALFVRGAGG